MRAEERRRERRVHRRTGGSGSTVAVFVLRVLLLYAGGSYGFRFFVGVGETGTSLCVLVVGTSTQKTSLCSRHGTADSSSLLLPPSLIDVSLLTGMEETIYTSHGWGSLPATLRTAVRSSSFCVGHLSGMLAFLCPTEPLQVHDTSENT